MDPAAPSQHPATRGRATSTTMARVASEVLAPVPLITIMSLLIGWHALSGRPVGIAHGLVLATFAALIPEAFILRAVRAGRVTDHHIARREQRRDPLLAASALTALGIAAVALLGGPRQLVVLGVAFLAVELPVAIVNAVCWKMSVHAAVAAGSTTILVIVFGPWALLTVVGVIANGWSRVHLAAHTVTQVISGAATGAVLSGLVFLCAGT